MRIEHAMQEMAAQPLVSAPGEKFAYSNSGYILLGCVIEKVSGVSYEQYITDNIIKPAGLENTAYDHVRPIVKNRASGYVFDGDHLVNADMGDMSGTHSAGALHSTVDDLYKFDQALAEWKDLSQGDSRRSLSTAREVGRTSTVQPGRVVRIWMDERGGFRT